MSGCIIFSSLAISFFIEIPASTMAMPASGSSCHSDRGTPTCELYDRGLRVTVLPADSAQLLNSSLTVVFPILPVIATTVPLSFVRHRLPMR